MQVTIYIRKENEDTWSRFGKDKSKKVNEWLSGQYTEGDKVEDIPIQPNNTSTGSTDRVPAALNIPGVQVGIADGLPCCKASKPCKHWVFDDLNTVWRNELTGKEREA